MNPQHPRFTVQGVGRFPAQLERLIATAERRGLRHLLIDVLTQMQENLEARPNDWGDPYTNYRGLNAVVYGRALFPAWIRIEYAVHNIEPLVWVSAIVPLSGSPFE